MGESVRALRNKEGVENCIVNSESIETQRYGENEMDRGIRTCLDREREKKTEDEQIM